MKSKMSFLMFFTLTLLSLKGFSQSYVIKTDFVFPDVDTESVSGLKVMWWNLGCSSDLGLNKIPSRIRNDFHPKNQFENLKTLIGDLSLAPDVLILGEYCPRYFDSQTDADELLRDFYPYEFHLDRSNPLFELRNGFLILSKYELELQKNSVLLEGDFLDQERMLECEEAYGREFYKHSFTKGFYDRPLLEFRVEKNGRVYNLSPIHLSNPWRVIHRCLGSNRAKTWFELTFGEDNSVYHQALQLVDEYSDSSRTILIGDFNAPKRVKVLQSMPFSILDNVFNSAISSMDNTFYDERSGFGSFSLDHAFLSEDLVVKEEMILPFAGSDHLPIYIIVE